MKTKETSTREQAMAWWNNLSLETQQEITKKTRLAIDSPLIGIGLTGREIEEIWNQEVQNSIDVESWSNDGSNRKPNQKQYSQKEVDRLLDQQAAITTSQLLKNNQKQFKQFDESLFKSYIDKFSDEDKLKALQLLAKECKTQMIESICNNYLATK